MYTLPQLAVFGLALAVAGGAALAATIEDCPDPIKELVHNNGCWAEKTIYGSASSDCPSNPQGPLGPVA